MRYIWEIYEGYMEGFDDILMFEAPLIDFRVYKYNLVRNLRFCDHFEEKIKRK